MSAICPISNKVVEYLSASEGEPLHDSGCALEVFSSSAGAIDFSILITRGIEPDTFLACSLTSIDFTSNQPSYTMEPVETFLGFLGLSQKDVPICDAGHVGPLSSEGMLRFLELTHATYAVCKMHDQADALRENFRLCVHPRPKQIDPQDVPAEGNVFRPQHWHRP